MSIIGAAPVRKATYPPLVTALAATADGELPRAGIGGSMSIIGAAGGAAPVRKATYPPLVTALAATADGELPRAGKCGSQSIIGAAPVKKSKHKAHQAVIDASGGSLTKSAFCALTLPSPNVNGTCRECNRACPRHTSLCLKGVGCDAGHKRNPEGRVNGTCRECNRACGRSISLCLIGTGCDAPQTWIQCNACDKWRKVPYGRAGAAFCGEGQYSRAR
jgi:hypothetical protein